MCDDLEVWSSLVVCESNVALVAGLNVAKVRQAKVQRLLLQGVALQEDWVKHLGTVNAGMASEVHHVRSLIYNLKIIKYL